MANPSSGDKAFPIQAADGKVPQFKLTVASASGDKGAPLGLADGKVPIMKTVPLTASGERGFPVLMADGRALLVKEESAITGTLWCGNFPTAGGHRCRGAASMDADGTLTPLYTAADPVEDGYTNATFSIIRQPYGWIEYDGDFYTYGYFQSIAGVEINNIARWDAVAEAWEPLHADEPNSTVKWAEVIGSDLYIGGDFTTIGGTTVNRVAKWNGTSWAALGATPGVDSTVYCMVQYGGNLVVGGTFNNAGGSSLPKLAQWDGASWSAVGVGAPNNYLRGLGVANEKLYASGFFTNIGGNPAGYVAEWDGATWDDMDGGFSGWVYAGGGVGDKAFFSTTGSQMGMNLPSPLDAKKNVYWDGEWKNMSDAAGSSYGIYWNQWGESEADVLCYYSGTNIGGLEAERMAIWNTTGFRPVDGDTQTPETLYAYYYDSANSLHLFGARSLIGNFLRVDSYFYAAIFDGTTWANIPRPDPDVWTAYWTIAFGFYWGTDLWVGVTQIQDAVTEEYYSNVMMKVDASGTWTMPESDPGEYWQYFIADGGIWLKTDPDTGNLLIARCPIVKSSVGMWKEGFYQFDGTTFSKVTLPDYRNSSGVKDPSKEINDVRSKVMYDGKYHYAAHNNNLYEFYDSSPAIVGYVVGYVDSDEWVGYVGGSPPTYYCDSVFVALDSLFCFGRTGGLELEYWDGANYVLLKNKAGITLPASGATTCTKDVSNVIAYEDKTALYVIPYGVSGSAGVFKIEEETNAITRVASIESITQTYNDMLVYDGDTILFSRLHYLVPVEGDVEQDIIRGSGAFKWDNENNVWTPDDRFTLGYTSGHYASWRSVIREGIYY